MPCGTSGTTQPTFACQLVTVLLALPTTLTPLHVHRADEFQPGILQKMSRLRKLCLTRMRSGDFDVPESWSDLRVLQLRQNGMSQLPGELSRLSSLQELVVQSQEADLQITEPMHFLTQLRDLRSVKLNKLGDDPYFWNHESLHALREGQLLIMNTPGCSVELSFGAC